MPPGVGSAEPISQTHNDEQIIPGSLVGSYKFKTKSQYKTLCVCACIHVCVHMNQRICIRVCVRMDQRACIRVCVCEIAGMLYSCLHAYESAGMYSCLCVCESCACIRVCVHVNHVHVFVVVCM